MPITLVRSENTHCLWNHCKNSFLDQIGTNTGPGDYPSFLWVTNRNLRDSFLECAQSRGLKGWLDPPFRTWNELPESFGINQRPIGQLTRQLLISHTCLQVASEIGFTHYQNTPHGVLPGRMLEHLFSELLPEGLTQEKLKKGFSSLEVTDDFGQKRNRWIIKTYGQYLHELEARGFRDVRATSGLLAKNIESGKLSDAIGNAKTLHIYGAVNLQGKERLFRALNDQSQVIVKVYLPLEEEASEWATLSSNTEYVEALQKPSPSVQSLVNKAQEAKWVSTKVKEILVKTEVEPHEIAVICRDFRNDSPQIEEELQSAGIPITTRNDIPLLECGAVAAFLDLFSSASKNWTYPSLRSVITSTYFDTGLHLRAIDDIGRGSQFSGLSTWEEKLSSRELKTSTRPYGGQVEGFKHFKVLLDPLAEKRTLTGWIDFTLTLIRSNPFKIRENLSQVVGDDWLIPRIDQRGFLLLENILIEWSRIADAGEILHLTEWHSHLRQILNTQYLSLETPIKKGVQLLNASEGALTPFKHTFIIHANHGVFPSAFYPGGILTNQDRLFLNDSGIPVPNQSRVQQWEEALWQGLVQQPSVTICYRKTDEEGQELDPSRLVPEHQDNTSVSSNNDTTILTNPSSLLFDEAEHLFHKWKENSPPQAKVPEPQLLKHAILTAYTEFQRGRGNLESNKPSGLKANPWNGYLADPYLIDHLDKEFGSKYVWSPTKLSSYSTLPFYFWMKEILRIEKPKHLADELDYTAIGEIAHNILEEFYRPITTGQLQQPTELDPVSKERLQEIITIVLQEAKDAETWLGNPILWQLNQKPLVEMVKGYLDWELRKLEQVSEYPLLVEHRFGDDSPLGLEISGLDNKQIERSLHIRGKIDRVDRSQSKHALGKDTFSVIDYKRRYIPAAKGYLDGTTLQAPIYLLALEKSGYDITGGRGLYRNIISNDRVPSTSLEKKIPKNRTWNGAKIEVDKGDVFSKVKESIFTIPKLVREGRFEAVLAYSAELLPWHPDIEVTRSTAKHPEKSSRFDE